MDYHLLRSFTLAMHVPPHDKTIENHITFPKESENTTLSTCMVEGPKFDGVVISTRRFIWT